MRTLTKQMRDAITPAQAIEFLRAGNERFQQNLKANRNLLQQVNETSDGQHPFAFVLSCIDSRTSAELIFDQGLGDIFSCRVAGNVLNDDILGSMEFACKVAGARAVVVLGHTRCGAVQGACEGLELGHLTGLLRKIREAVIRETASSGMRTSANSDFVERVASMNVGIVQRQIIERSPILAAMLDAGEIALAGGMYDVETGRVEFHRTAGSEPAS